MNVDEIVNGIFSKNRRALARAITYVENELPGSKEILKAIHSRTGRAHVIGLTGFPGVGKSTIMSKLTEEFRKRGKMVGIVAVDPGSPFTGGALLGDRLRMEGFDANKQLWVDPGVFFRSMSSRGRAGGLAAKTGDVVKILDAYGFDIIFVETVGAGQGEVDIVKVADTVVVILMPEVGDDIQLSKAGILEIADIFVVNKADLEGVEKTVRWLRSMVMMSEEVVQTLSTLTHADEARVLSGEIFKVSNHWVPPIHTTIADRGVGISELADSIEKHYEYQRKSGGLLKRRSSRAKIELEEIILGEIKNLIKKKFNYTEILKEIVENKKDPYTVAEEIISKLCYER
ncbi:MAG: methylmalonyl Co-A mutase-associated GTPase MeaB [Archaeoglobaceae archaeon]|nr:methylmalonyl Co-A mutase-associated GTPase MeaB [Archaeoglobaceae archaeon]MCX8152307.1 methylmalonyl Co-A mutase-associated GTPase MeaB [Archaeoglobaceae archaeon]MDW8013985.1 methylmalonyl Co-A mutase-associated GTPase MeaB [Archaeoglobaceae archaeon]